MSVDVDDSMPESCPACARPLAEWTENDGQGVVSGGVTYCSAECAVRDAARQQVD